MQLNIYKDFGRCLHKSMLTLILILIGTALVYAGYETYLWNQLQHKRLQVLEIKVAVIQQMLIRSPELQKIIIDAPEEAFRFQRLH